MPTLREGWKQRRNDRKVEQHWRANPPRNGWERYQAQWNFIETDYSERPSNNGLDLGNPGFAFTTNLARYA